MLVSSDANFHACTKQTGLKALGVSIIAYPKDAAALSGGIVVAI
jgi:hypothetical protein